TARAMISSPRQPRASRRRTTGNRDGSPTSARPGSIKIQTAHQAVREPLFEHAGRPRRSLLRRRALAQKFAQFAERAAAPAQIETPTFVIGDGTPVDEQLPPP